MQNKPRSPSIPRSSKVNHQGTSGCRFRGESSAGSEIGSTQAMDHHQQRLQTLPPPFMLPPLQNDSPSAAICAQQESQRYSFPPGNSSQYNFRDPLVTAQETDDAMTALASARRLPSMRLKELLSYAQPACNGCMSPVDIASHNLQQPTHHPNRSPDAPVEMAIEHSYSRPRTNDGHRTHACEYCGKRFGRPSALKIHLSMHTGEKPFLCPEGGCNRSFSVRSNMSRHVRIVHHRGQNQDEGDEELGERQEH